MVFYYEYRSTRSIWERQFSSVDMRWNEVLKEDKYVDSVAIISYSIVSDFTKGDEINLDTPCSF